MSPLSSKKTPIASPVKTKLNPLQQYFPWLYAFWKFSRPHTIIGTSLSVLALYLISLAELNIETIEGRLFSEIDVLVLALVACLCGNVYIVGLNQLEDIAIDQINKPHLPLASGEFSRREGQLIVAIAGVLAIALALSQGMYLFGMVGLSLLIGTAYSLPPIRLKRFPLWASFCIFTVRGVIVNLGLFLHFNQQFQGKAGVPASVWVLTLFILVFTFAIAIFKDVPDIEGDRRYNISTFTIRMGKQSVFNLTRWVLTGCYLGMAIAGAFLPTVNSLFLVVTHVLALGLFWFWSFKVDLDNKRAIALFYQFIWKLFFLEYLLFPAACLLS